MSFQVRTKGGWRGVEGEKERPCATWYRPWLSSRRWRNLPPQYPNSLAPITHENAISKKRRECQRKGTLRQILAFPPRYKFVILLWTMFAFRQKIWRPERSVNWVDRTPTVSTFKISPSSLNEIGREGGMRDGEYRCGWNHQHWTDELSVRRGGRERITRNQRISCKVSQILLSMNHHMQRKGRLETCPLRRVT